MKRIVLSSVVFLGLLSLAPRAEAGRVGGSWGAHGVIRVGYTMVYDNVYFRVGQVAKVAVSGDGPMRLEIYDQAGNLIVWSYSHFGPQGQECEVSWRPARTAPYTIKIVNLQLWGYRYSYSIQYGVGTN